MVHRIILSMFREHPYGLLEIIITFVPYINNLSYEQIITLIMCVAFSATVSEQTVKVEDRVKALEGEVKTLKGQLKTQSGQITSIQARLNKLADRNAEYKKALDIKQTLNTTDAYGYQYSFVSAVGHKATGKLTVTLNLFNPCEGREKLMAQAQFSDYAGNAYVTYEYNFGNLENARPPLTAILTEISLC